jgi:hypothetical protein
MTDIVVSYAADTEQLVRGTLAGIDALNAFGGAARLLAPGLAATGDASDSATAGLLKLGASAMTAASGTDKLTEAQRRVTAAAKDADAEHGTAAGAADKAAKAQMRALDEVTEAARRGSQARVADAQRELDFAASLGEAGAAFQVAAQRRVTEAAREAAAEQDRIRKSDATTQIEIAKLKLAAAKSELAAEVEEHKITAAQKLAAELDLTRQLEALELRQFTIEQQGLDQDSFRYKELANRKLVAAQQLETQLAALDRERAQNAKRADEQEVASWRSAIGEITGAEDTFIRDVLTKRQSMSKSLEQMSAQLVLKEISDDARYYTMKLLYSLLGLEAEEKAETGGLLVHLLTESKKTAATASGTATRTALDASGQTSFLGRIATQLAQWLGLETSKTAATQAGDATRATVDTAAAAAGRAVAVAGGMSQISIDAAVAAAGTMAAISAIPYIGPFLAPEMAAEAYAVTMGFAAGMGGVALDVGAWEIPGTMAATLHSGEMVVPATFASGLRAMTSGAGAAGGTAGTVSPNFNINALDARSVVALFNNPNIMRQFARNLSGYMAMNPSVRGAY